MEVICPFCAVLKDVNNPQIIERGKYVTAIFKTYRSSNVNILIISNEHHINHNEITEEQSNQILNETVQMTKRLFQGSDWSMKCNNGRNAEQTIFHLHTHIYSSENWPLDAKWNYGRSLPKSKWNK